MLDVQDGKCLLLSKYGLDAKPYNTPYVSVTWENCTLRNWLNSDFLKVAFSAQEQSSILTTEVDNSNSQGYSRTNGGNNTQDQVFLLSYHEAFDLYFKNDDARKCAPTQYAKAKGAYLSDYYEVDGRGTGWWWLRSPGKDRDHAARVSSGGARGNYYVSSSDVSVRPALWINLESNIF